MLVDIDYEDLVGVVNFMYKGEVNVLQEKLSGFLKVKIHLESLRTDLASCRKEILKSTIKTCRKVLIKILICANFIYFFNTNQNSVSSARLTQFDKINSLFFLYLSVEV